MLVRGTSSQESAVEIVCDVMDEVTVSTIERFHSVSFFLFGFACPLSAILVNVYIDISKYPFKRATSTLCSLLMSSLTSATLFERFCAFEESSLTFDGFAAHEGSRKQGNGKGGLKLLIHRHIVSKYIYYHIYIYICSITLGQIRILRCKEPFTFNE